MRNKIAIPFVLLGTLLLFLTCQKEDAIKPETLKEPPQLKIEIIHNPDFSRNRPLFEKLSQFKAKGLAPGANLQAREIYVEQYGFTLDDEIVKFISYGEYHSYTFPIWRDEDNGLVENLVLSKQPDGSYLAFIVSYELTEAEKEAIKDGQAVPDLDEKAIMEVLSLGPGPLERARYVWTGEGSIYWDTVSNSCMLLDIDSSGETVAFNWQPWDCPSGYQYEIDIDGDGGQGGGGTSDTGSDPDDDGFWDGDPDLPPDDPIDPTGGGNGTSGDGTGTANDPDPNDPDDPLGPSDCLEVDQNGNCIGDLTSPLIRDRNCEKLKNKITNVPLIRTRLHTMKVESESSEKGLRVDIHPTTGVYTPSDILNENNGEAHIKIRVNPYTVVIAHTHPPSTNGFYAMFSGPDITKMGEMIKQAQSGFNAVVSPIEITHILIADGRTFAIRFDDAASVQALLEIYEDKVEKNKFEKKLESDYKSDRSGPPLYQSTTTIAQQQAHLYKLFSGYNLNMSMYEANYDANGFINDWQKINKETLEKEPCN